MIGSPLFGRITLALPSGKSFTVEAVGNSDANPFIQSAKLDGATLNDPVISYARIRQGGLLTVQMGPRPSSWGSRWRAKGITD